MQAVKTIDLDIAKSVFQVQSLEDHTFFGTTDL